MSDDKDHYRPRQIEEIEDSGLSLINEPVAPDNTNSSSDQRRHLQWHKSSPCFYPHWITRLRERKVCH